MTAALAAWSLIGLAWGLIAAWLTVQANPTIHGRDVLVVSAILAGIYAVGCGAIGLTVEVLRGPVLRRGDGERVAWSRRMGADFILALFVSAVLAVAIYLTASVSSRSVTLVLRGAALVAVVAYAVFDPFGLRRAAVAGRLAAGILGIVVLGSGALLARGESTAPSADPFVAPSSQARVFLIGLDGADWRRIDALIAQGRLPAFDSLLRSGVRAPLRTIRPTWSPIIWNTIATGMAAKDHGIYDFAETPVPGLSRGIQRLRRAPVMLPRFVGIRRLVNTLFDVGALYEIPVTSRHRRAKAVWNILSEHGRRVAVVNWFASWPSEELNGYVVSNHTPMLAEYIVAKGLPGENPRFGVTYPEELTHDLAALEVAQIQEDPQAILSLDFFEEVSDPQKTKLLDVPESLRNLRFIHMNDQYSAAAVGHLLDVEPLAFIAVLLKGIDNVSHHFGQLPRVVDRYYEYVDGVLAEMIDRADANTTLVIVSDHGWDYRYPALTGHGHAPDGMILLSGAGAKQGFRLDGRPSIYDVAPTILALFGFAPSMEMKGDALLGALQPPTVANAPTQPIRSYGPYSPPLGSAPRSAVLDEVQDAETEKLRALGYVQ